MGQLIRCCPLRLVACGLAMAFALVGCASQPATENSAPPQPQPPAVDGDGEADGERGGDDSPPLASSPDPDADDVPADDVPDDEAGGEPVGPLMDTGRRSADFPRWSGGAVGLADARLVSHAELDRFVLEFDGDVPSWRVMPTTGPLIEQPGRTEVELSGDTVLEVRLVPVSTIDRDAGEPMAAYDGPSHLTSSGGGIEEALLTTDASDIVVWGLGVAGEASFAVGTLDDPPRLVVDVVSDEA